MSYCSRFILLLVFVCFSFSVAHAATRRVLFLGNSFIYTNDMPLLLKNLAASMGDTLIYDQNTIGGYTLQAHSTDATSISKIFSQQWDIVVIQEQSQLPAFPPAQVDTTTFRYGHVLDSMVHANDTCTQTMFMMTWGYRDGDASNCAFYPPICTYAGMQQSLRQSYMQMTQDNNAVVAPVGAAWKAVRDSFMAINLYATDLIHPGLPGSYLAANVFYASIFHRNPLKSTYTAGIATTDAQALRRMAAKVTLDSLGNWQQYGHYPYANFTYAAAGTSVTFTNQSQKAATYSWVFGDANTSTSTSPSHNYSATGTYIVALTASSNCFSETRTDTLHLTPAGLEGTENLANNLKLINGLNGRISFIAASANNACSLEVYDMSGRKIKHLDIEAPTRYDEQFAPGIYIYRASDKQSGEVYKGKFLVY